ncbi:hypothetical protein MA16_Dca008050 [Dendrobium catenatum]|uniref:Uncharacterized protein n=1 Tax=Dendrobium catenatum TaxID=906689 RepID=A0A2I0WCU7_9ASPA|nr:hypothetical protein MA16_Dca008050 [Dendrobium catenatum]
MGRRTEESESENDAMACFSRPCNLLTVDIQCSGLRTGLVDRFMSLNLHGDETFLVNFMEICIILYAVANLLNTIGLKSYLQPNRGKSFLNGRHLPFTLFFSLIANSVHGYIQHPPSEGFHNQLDATEFDTKLGKSHAATVSSEGEGLFRNLMDTSEEFNSLQRKLEQLSDLTLETLSSKFHRDALFH